MTSIANSTSNPSVIDALTTPARSGSSAPATSSTASPAGGAGRGPAVLVTLSLQAGPGPSDDAAQSLADQAQKNADALTTLDQNDKSKAEQDKAEAKEKLELARKKLQTLQIMGGDPESLAKQAKAIGKDIKDAASEYTSALKAEMSGNPAAAGAQAAGDPTATGQDSHTADAAAADSTTAAAVANAAPGADAAPAADKAPAAGAAPDAGAAATPQTAVQAYQSAADRATANARFDPIEENVLAGFKGAAHDVKAVMEQAARQLKAKDPTAAHSGANTEAEMDKAIQDLTDTIRLKEGGGDGDVPATGDTPAATPALDISA